MTYAEKLKSPKWQKKRLQILQRDGFQCWWCGDKETTLHVHHQQYVGNDPWDAPDCCLITVCENCHNIEHLELTPLEKVLLESLKNRHLGDFEMINLIHKNVLRLKGVK